jgi:hypothetical protein
MPSRTAKFVSAAFVNILAGLLLATVARAEPAEADGCLSAPWGDAPAGSHWRYHVDQGRKCWYLRRQASEQAEALPQSSATAAKSIASPSPPARPSAVDARAELRPQAVRDPANSPPAIADGNSANAADNSAASPNAPAWNNIATVATRWPDLPTVSPLASAPPAAATMASNEAAQPSVDPAQAIVPSIPFAHFSVTVRPETIWTLIAAVTGALAFAGVAALLSRRRRSGRLRRRVARSTRGPIWETTDDDRIILSDHSDSDVRDYRPRFGRVGAATASTGRKPRFARRAPRYAQR